MAVILDRHDGHIKIFEMASGAQDTELTPSGGWLFVQGVTLSETPQSVASHRIGASYQREEVLARNRVLTVEKWHDPNAGTDDFLLGIDPTKEYWLECHLYDPREGETESGAIKYTLKYCRPKERTMATGNINKISRNWSVGTIS